jgi:UTP--glucose-1-phosphate uridylyltransferase
VPVSDNTIDRAIIPAAGLGTRLRPLTRAIPKEMLPLGRKPVLEYVLEEIRAAGIKKALFVISPGKEMIRQYFGDGSAWGVECVYVVQPEMRGLGDAILCGREWTQGEPTAVVFGDCIIESGDDLPLSRLVKTHVQNEATGTVLVEHVARERTSRYGIVSPADEATDGAAFAIGGIVEKPAPEAAPSTLAVAARWVLDPTVFEMLHRMRPAIEGEMDLTSSVAACLAEGYTGWAVPLQAGERRRDIGGWQSYLEAVAVYAAADREFGETARAAALKETR